jgi:tRNA pseudouridine13 synthase
MSNKFYTKTKGIGGRIKQRISDFKVEEIPKKVFPMHEKLKPIDKKYTVFWMEKFNWDTTGALMTLAKHTGVSVSSFGFAGTKDKRAITRQRVSVDVHKEKLENIKIKDIKLYGFEDGKRLELGDSDGNKFEIVIRDVDLSKKVLEDRLTSFGEVIKNGIPNIFGPQRFGITRPVTHLIGMEMLKGNIEEAVKIYLCKVYPDEHEESKKARLALGKNWNKKGFRKALEMFPRQLKYERIILEGLSRNPNDFAGSFKKIPRKLRKIFPNAVQSLIFNRVLKKIKIGDGEIPIVGFDTVLGSGDLSGLIKKILREEGLQISDFKLNSLKDMKCSGGFRKVRLDVKDFSWKIEKDEINPKKLKVITNFSLPSGSYATVVLRELMKS